MSKTNKNASHDFKAIQLEHARFNKAFSISKLAEELDVSKQTVSNWEKGKSKPSPEKILQLSHVLKKPVTFFFKNSSVSYLDSAVSFRKKKNTLKQELNSVCERNRSLADLLHSLENRLEFRPASLPKSINPHELDEIEIEVQALKLRELWGLTLCPISNITRLLENKGIMCLLQRYPRKIDAFSYTLRLMDCRQSLICANEKTNFYRHRFTLCHELAHLVLHSSCNQAEFDEHEKKFEKQANLFASAFLMPAQSFTSSVIAVSENYLKRLKKEWGVSIAALVQRLYSIKLINESKLHWFHIELSKKGWRNIEPYDKDTPIEKPYLLDGYLKIFFEDIASKKDLLKTLCRYEEEAYELTGSDFFKPFSNNSFENKFIPFSL